VKQFVGLVFAVGLILCNASNASGESGFPLFADIAPNTPSTQPSQEASTQPTHTPTGAERTIAEFIGHFSGYEPMYFIAGPVDPLAKFQFSFKYRLLNEDAPLAKALPPLAGLHFAYTQLALWQIDKPSAPLFDNNYKPEFFWSDEDIQRVKIPGVSQFGFQGGYGHESNGKGGTDSREINILFARPIVTFGDPEAFHCYIAPKFYVYLGTLYGNTDIARYRGYCDLRTVIGWRQGLELSALGRVGKNFNRGSIQLDLTYPLRNLLMNNFDVYLDAQYFYGYGESLLTYNQRTSAFRIGLALVR
jgi:phospholipase A1